MGLDQLDKVLSAQDRHPVEAGDMVAILHSGLCARSIGLHPLGHGQILAAEIGELPGKARYLVNVRVHRQFELIGMEHPIPLHHKGEHA